MLQVVGTVGVHTPAGRPAKIVMIRYTSPSSKSEFNVSVPAGHCLFATLRQVLHHATCEGAIALACLTVAPSRARVIVLIPPQYETSSDDVRRMFEEHGEVKTFFDLISTRGMVFVTYVSYHIILVMEQNNNISKV